jgi:hypothetical protein
MRSNEEGPYEVLASICSFIWHVLVLILLAYVAWKMRHA